MRCKICNRKSILFDQGKVLNKHNVNYYKCTSCGFIQTQKAFWLKEAYKSSINLSDTGIVARNIQMAKVASVCIYFICNKNGRYLDYAGGYGLLTRLMRDIGFDFYWCDPFSSNIFARGFEYIYGSKSNKAKFDLITAFECFEHFENPLTDIAKILTTSTNVLFTTEVIPEPTPRIDKWWYYGLEHGQHLSFYTIKSLRILAKTFNLNIYSHRNIHLLCKSSINDAVYRLLIKTTKLLYPIVTFKTKSRTVDDMNHLISTQR